MVTEAASLLGLAAAFPRGLGVASRPVLAAASPRGQAAGFRRARAAVYRRVPVAASRQGQAVAAPRVHVVDCLPDPARGLTQRGPSKSDL